MPGGDIYPYSALPGTPDWTFEHVHITTDPTQDAHDVGLGVRADLAVDAIWRLRFQMPPALPQTGVGQLRLKGIVGLTGDARVNVKWRSASDGEFLHGTALNAEGVQTYTFAQANVLRFFYIILDADSLVADEVVLMDLTFETIGWTLSANSTWFPSICWR